jgi:hypothetical protein
MMGRQIEMTDFPIIPHSAAGIDCCGCIVVNVRGKDAELSCNECGAVLGVIDSAILSELISLIPTKQG